MADESGDDAARENTNEPMSYSERGKLGGRPPKTTAEEVLAVLQEVVAERDLPYAKTRDIADHPTVQIGEQATRNRLHKLVDEGKVRTEKVGAARVWFPVETDESGE